MFVLEPDVDADRRVVLPPGPKSASRAVVARQSADRAAEQGGDIPIRVRVQRSQDLVAVDVAVVSDTPCRRRLSAPEHRLTVVDGRMGSVGERVDIAGSGHPVDDDRLHLAQRTPEDGAHELQSAVVVKHPVALVARRSRRTHQAGCGRLARAGPGCGIDGLALLPEHPVIDEPIRERNQQYRHQRKLDGHRSALSAPWGSGLKARRAPAAAEAQSAEGSGEGRHRSFRIGGGSQEAVGAWTDLFQSMSSVSVKRCLSR